MNKQTNRWSAISIQEVFGLGSCIDDQIMAESEENKRQAESKNKYSKRKEKIASGENNIRRNNDFGKPKQKAKNLVIKLLSK